MTHLDTVSRETTLTTDHLGTLNKEITMTMPHLDPVLDTAGAGYAGIMVTRPQTLGYGLADSPAGLAAFFYDKFNDWTYSGGDAGKTLTKDEMLDDISLYWLTNTAASSARLYWENNNNFNAVEQKTSDISIPVAVTVFPGEI
jgi:hypothetical protein